VAKILTHTCFSLKNLDGGYAMAGLLGHGDAFHLGDPAGIRTLRIIIKMMKL
jgi:amidophosphoribosyltransferase